MALNLLEQLEEARNKVRVLENAAASASCLETNHDWQLLGGRNCGCYEYGYSCSFPVYQCTKCKDCDYGDNEEAVEIKNNCKENACCE